MFLSSFNSKQKDIFYQLAEALIAVDGHITEEETLMLNAMKEEMGLGIKGKPPPRALSIEKECRVFDSPATRFFAATELFRLSFADRKLVPTEKDFIRTILAELKIPQDISESLESWARRETELARELAGILHRMRALSGFEESLGPDEEFEITG